MAVTASGLKVMIVGGLGYLGYNLAKRFVELGANTLVVYRPESLRLSVRHRLYLSLSTFSDLLPIKCTRRRCICQLVREHCPDVLVYAAGRLSGSRRELVESNALHARAWISCYLNVCVGYAVYISALLALIDPKACSDNGVVREESEHLKGCRVGGVYPASKALGERLVLRLCNEGTGKLAIVRPGLLVGEWGYHPEWLTLFILSKLAFCHGGPRLLLTPAKDVADLIMALYTSNLGCAWVNASPYSLELCTILRYMADALRARPKLPTIVPAKIIALSPLLRGMISLSKYRFESSIARMIGFEWRTTPRRALEEAASWLEKNIDALISVPLDTFSRLLSLLKAR